MNFKAYRMLWASLVAVCLHSVPLHADDVVMLDGTTVTGKVVSMDDTWLEMTVDDQSRKLAVDQLLKLTWTQHEIQPAAQQRVGLTTGGQFTANAVASDGLKITVDSPVLPGLSVDLKQTRTILLKPLDDTTQPQWTELLKKASADDMLVVQKGDVLDFLPGVITEFDDNEIMFLYQGSEIPVKSSKVFGMIFPRQPAKSDAKALVETTAQDRFQVQRVTLSDGQLQLTLESGQELKIPIGSVRRLDLSQGRVRYLSDLEPEQVEHTPYFDTVWTYQRDRTSVAKPLEMNGKRYPKGLWIHSKTVLTYRLAGDYSQLRTVIGIDDAVAFKGLGHVRLEISGDDQILLERTVAAADEPEAVELDLAGVRFLKILVDFGEGLDIGDHLVLGDAKLIK